MEYVAIYAMVGIIRSEVICCFLAFAACFQKATEVNTTKIVVMRKNKGKPGKTWKNWKFRGQKTAEKGGKTAEKDGLWTWRSKSCRKHAQKVVSRILSLLVFFCREILLKAAIQVIQCRWKPTLQMCNYEHIYTVYTVYTLGLVFCIVSLAAFIT